MAVVLQKNTTPVSDPEPDTSQLEVATCSHRHTCSSDFISPPRKGSTENGGKTFRNQHEHLLLFYFLVLGRKRESELKSSLRFLQLYKRDRLMALH